MPQKKAAKKTRAPKMRPDIAETAYRVMQEAIGETRKTLPLSERAERNSDAVKRGAKGGARGGKARNAKLTADERQRMAIVAAQARWKKRGS